MRTTARRGTLAHESDKRPCVLGEK